MESEGRFGALGVCGFLFVYDGFDVIELLLCVWPQDEGFFEKV